MGAMSKKTKFQTDNTLFIFRIRMLVLMHNDNEKCTEKNTTVVKRFRLFGMKLCCIHSLYFVCIFVICTSFYEEVPYLLKQDFF